MHRTRGRMVGRRRNRVHQLCQSRLADLVRGRRVEEQRVGENALRAVAVRDAARVLRPLRRHVTAEILSQLHAL